MATGAAAKFIPPGGYNQLLKVDGVKGKRIGIVREPFFNFTNNHALAHTFEKHLQALRQQGAVLEMLKEFGQDIFLAAEATNGIGETELNALRNLSRLTREGYVKLMKKYKLDALVTGGSSVAAVLTIGGFPAISVPAAYDKGVPIGICFSGLKGSELKLIEIDYGFEQATLIRNPPYIFALRMYN
ncbi:putative disease resistance response protein-like [Capsicum annuum]|nr:putative disease resistance response protein-like [Capsicum annuum]